MWTLPYDFNPGARKRAADPRDVAYRDLIAGAPQVDWSHDFDLLHSIGLNLPLKDQGGSGSCVGQASSYLAEIAEFSETGRFTRLSARDIYSRIYIPPEGGAYGYKGMSVICGRGIATDLSVSSYMNGLPPTETFMRQQNNTPSVIQEALVRKGKNYAIVDTKSIDEIAYAIEHQRGVVFGVAGSNEGWQTGMVRPPEGDERQWGHFLVATKRAVINGVRGIMGPNSWSERWGSLGGYYFIPEDYFSRGFAFNGFTLVDLPNTWLDQINMKRRIRLNGAQDQYTVEGKYKFLIPDLDTLSFIRDEIKIVADGDAEVVSKEEFDSYLTGRALPSVKVDRAARAFYESSKDAFEPNTQ